MTGGACCRAARVVQGELSYDMRCARGRAFYVRVYSNDAILLQRNVVGTVEALCAN